MEKKHYLKKIWLSACVYYTATTFLLIFLFWLISDDITRAMHPVALMLILPFSITFAAANTLYRHATFATWLKVLLHYALTMIGIWCFLFLPNKTAGGSGSGAFILYMVLTLIYAIMMGVVLYFGGRIKRIARDETEYTGVYKK